MRGLHFGEGAESGEFGDELRLRLMEASVRLEILQDKKSREQASGAQEAHRTPFRGRLEEENTQHLVS